MEFAYDGGGLAKGGGVTLYYDGQKVGEGRIEQYRAHDVLLRTRRPTSAARAARRSRPTTTRETSAFTGKIHWVQIDLGKDDHDHLISPEERLRLAMIRQ